MQLSIIILSYNTKELTIRCIGSIIKYYQKQLGKEEFELIVVDNASTDGSAEAVSNFQFPSASWRTNFQLKLIKNKKNYGFSKGNNIGAKSAKGKYLLFLNSDTEVLDEGLAGMVDFFEKHKDVGVLGAKLQNSDGTAQPSAGTFYTLGTIFVMLFGGERFGLLRESPLGTKAVDWVSGGAMMIRRSFFEKLVGFDERFFMYMEDMELCFRAKKEGLLTYFYPHVSIVHKTLGSSNRTFAILNIYKGLLYFYKKHTNYMEYLVVKLLLVVKACMAIVIGVVTRNGYLTSTYRKALALL